MFNKIPESITNLVLGPKFNFDKICNRLPLSVKEIIVQGSREEDQIKNAIEYCV